MLSTTGKKLFSRWAGTRVGHEAVMMEDARAVLAADRARARKTNPSDPSEAEQMGNLHVGDVYNESVKPPAAGTLAKLAIAGALLASGAGAGAAIPLLLDAFADKPPPAIEQPEHVDNDTQYRLEFGTPTLRGVKP